MIGIFDSGLGGLTVIKSIMRLLPEYQILYLGDTARLPYGNRSPEVIYKFTQEGVNFLFQKGCTLVILACNTASAVSLKRIQEEYLPKNHPGKKVLGVILPLVEKCVVQTKNSRIGVIGTRSTIQSQAYAKEILKINKNIQIFQNSAPLLVPLIEEGWIKRPETKKIARYYLRPLKNKQIDTLILGCTHYPFLHQIIQSIMGKRCLVLHSADIIAQSLKNYLTRHKEIECNLAKNKNHNFYVTDITDNFIGLAQSWLGFHINLEKVSL